ncbi:MAG TPA: type IV pili methyl-accepting chemotaxis transducer N-terminal domain-containing protein [Pirellulales bacterium]|nr:type IV pili methyl-accepting chemotaxis transducer N-terminal domain-containing protein [Pirellulales bacterium]
MVYWRDPKAIMAGGLLLDDSINTADNDRSDFAERLVRPLRFRYAVVFVAVASLSLADQAVIQPLLVRLNGYAPVINTAGRQRMLSQKLAKQSLALEFGVGESSAEARRDELSKTVEQWSTAHRILRDGDARRGISPITTPQIAAALRDLDPDFAAMRAAASQLAAVHEPSQWLGQSLSDAPAPQTGASPGRIVQAQTEPFTGQALPQPPAERIANADSSAGGMALVRGVLDHEADYLSGMERVVAMLESEAQQQVAWLRQCALAAVVMAVLLLASLYAFVLRPATTLIRQQLRMLAASDDRHRSLADLLRRARDELELRVAERTSELSQANTALECEMRHRQRGETRVRRLSSDLAHASRITALGQLATGLAHELNQPLGAIANYAGACELQLENELADNHPSRRAITEVKRSALRAGDIVRRMRNFMRRSADQASRVEVNDLVREVAELCEPELRRCGVELSLDLSGETTAVVADPIQIQQVLVNLETLLDRIERAMAVDADWRRRQASFDALDARIARLNDRDRETLQLILAGESNKVMAAKLYISERAVEMRRAVIMRKLGVSSLAELIDLAVTHRLLAEISEVSTVAR